MDGKHDYDRSIKLIRCTVTNHLGEESVRHVFLDEFLLWEHLMISKHGAAIDDVSLGLWVSDDEFSRRQNIYQHAGDLEKVDRIVVDLFDAEYGFSNTVTRFVLSEECEQVREIILSHIPLDRRRAEFCQISVLSGICVRKFQHFPGREITLGMYEQSHCRDVEMSFCLA
jgi:hypothetical protein